MEAKMRSNGPFFAVLLKHDGFAVDSFVLCTTNPRASIGYTCRDKQSVLDWELTATLGPFAEPGTARECARDWIRGTRGHAAKLSRAPFLAEKYATGWYEGAPPDYMVGSTSQHFMHRRTSDGSELAPKGRHNHPLRTGLISAL